MLPLGATLLPLTLHHTAQELPAPHDSWRHRTPGSVGTMSAIVAIAIMAFAPQRHRLPHRCSYYSRCSPHCHLVYSRRCRDGSKWQYRCFPSLVRLRHGSFVLSRLLVRSWSTICDGNRLIIVLYHRIDRRDHAQKILAAPTRGRRSCGHWLNI